MFSPIHRCLAVSAAEDGVQRRFTRCFIRRVRVRSPREQKFREPPVSMEHGAVETEIGAERIELLSAGEQEAGRGHVPEVGADLDQAATVAHAPGRVVPRINPVDDQIRASIADPRVVLRIQTPVVRFCHLSLPR